MPDAQELCCPQCGSTNALGTEEMIQGSARADFYLVDGEVEVRHSGWTDVYWETSETVGVGCNSCGWNAKDFSALITVEAFEAEVEREEVSAGHA